MQNTPKSIETTTRATPAKIADFLISVRNQIKEHKNATAANNAHHPKWMATTIVATAHNTIRITENTFPTEFFLITRFPVALRLPMRTIPVQIAIAAGITEIQGNQIIVPTNPTIARTNNKATNLVLIFITKTTPFTKYFIRLYSKGLNLNPLQRILLI